ncbi:hypothetical protein KPL47_00990 [Clostridium estertheticum]|uniref:hypothetical protein n=1 Tax=Clostridium estertheticum TaxID=238834 RepID=UPI001C0C0715|nr:hypothetical protein [Clostridium estertheticum]MBU3174937.1 hypothetical protein [Clostridium estertheticum]
MFSDKDSSILGQIEKIKAIEISNSIQFITEVQEKSIPVDTDTGGEKTYNADSETVLNPQLMSQLAVFSKAANVFKNLSGFQIPEYRLVEIDNDMKSVILEYCYRKGIEIGDDFWWLGDLKREIKALVMPYSSGENLQGTEKEKRKYDLIEELWLKIHEYQEFFKFFSEVDKIPRLNCIISNRGTSFDEDIDIKILIPQGCILKINELPIPGLYLLKKSMKKITLWILCFVAKKWIQ